MFCKNCGGEIAENTRFCNHCGCSLKSENEKSPNKEKMKKTKKSRIEIYIGIAAIVVVIFGAIILTIGFLNVIKPQEESVVENSVKDDQTPTQISSEVDYRWVEAFAKTYAAKWNCKKFYDNGEWKTYELGKKLVICAYNFLNDRSYSTGGYNTYEGTTYNYLTNTITNHYEYVPVEIHSYHGEDIEYTCPSITITSSTIDLTDMGGREFSIYEFRYENIDGYDYLINDECGFALMYDGKYLEYCEPDAYGYYQGYYAYDLTDSLVNLTHIYDNYESN